MFIGTNASALTAWRLNMGSIKNIAILVTTLWTINGYAKDIPNDFDEKAQKVLTNHYQRYKNLEYFSGATLSIYIPKEKIRNYYIGHVSHAKDSQQITADTLFQIGSITKSFTAAITLQLEKEGKLHLNDTLKEWLPNYTKWSAIHIDELLNMTSGLPNYSDTPLWNAKEYSSPNYQWKNDELLSFVYPRDNFSPPLKDGYFYTNTGYVLTDLIIEKATQHSFQTELINRTIKPANLTNTYYPIPTVEKKIEKRIAHGYNYNQYDNPALLGADIVNNNLSWAAAAGGIIANSADVIKWVKALFIDDTILDTSQKKKLMHLISLATGKPIAETTKDAPQGFGLGVAQMYSKNKSIGNFWFYEGETLGFRAVYIYVPCNGVIISSIFNSATNTENDHSKELIMHTYRLILAQYPELNCLNKKINY